MANFELSKKKNRDGEDTGLLYVKAKGLKGSDLIFRNFAGEQGQYNPRGYRQFSVKLDNEEVIAEMRNHGYDVQDKVFHDRETDTDIPYNCFKVRLNLEPEYESQIPYIYTIANGVMTNIWPNGSKQGVDNLQRLRFDAFDINIDPSTWEYGNKSGVTAFVKRLVVYLADELVDDIEEEYSDYIMANASDAKPAFEAKDDDVPF